MQVDSAQAKMKQAFEQLWRALGNKSILRLYDPSRDLGFNCDASKSAILLYSLVVFQLIAQADKPRPIRTDTYHSNEFEA